MKISEEQVRYVAVLANLHLSPEEISRFQHDLDGILEHMEQLNRIDTTGVEPMAQVLFETEEGGLAARADQIGASAGQYRRTGQRPAARRGLFQSRESD